MTKRSKRAARGSAGGRRTPQAPKRGQGSRRPWAPIAIVGGVAVIIGLIVFVVWQQSRPEGDQSSKWVDVEADPAPDLPGEFVNLQEIYDGSYGAHGDNATAPHVQRAVDFEGDGNSNPPVGGPHWAGACSDDPSDSSAFCGPAPWGVYREPWEPETLVHNMEHGGVVLWYNTTDQEIIDELEDLFRDKEGLLVMAPYPDMEEEYIAITAWTRIDKFPVEEYSKDRVEEFIDTFDRRFNPEQF